MKSNMISYSIFVHSQFSAIQNKPLNKGWKNNANRISERRKNVNLFNSCHCIIQENFAERQKIEIMCSNCEGTARSVRYGVAS